MMPNSVADCVFLNGKVITVDSEDTIAEAIAIHDGKILQVGTTEAIQQLAGNSTKVYDLDGKTITPGIVDSHNHTVAFGITLLRRDLNYASVRSIEEIKHMIKEKTETQAPGTWIWDIGWDGDISSLSENRFPVQLDLDPISPEHPVVLAVKTGEFVVNSKGFDILLHGADYNIAPPDGLISPGDRLYGRIQSSAYDYPVEGIEKAILKAQFELFKVGVTAQKDAAADDLMIQAYNNLHERRELKIRSFLIYNLLGRTTIKDAQNAVVKYQPTSDDILAMRGVKCSYDGLTESRSAWLYEEGNKSVYEKDDNYFGTPRVAEPHLHGAVVKILHRAGFQVCTHCEGDITIDRYLDEIQNAIIDTPRTNCRHSIIHGNLPTDYALRKMVELGDNIVIEASSAYLYFHGTKYLKFLGPSRCRRTLPFKTWFERGIIAGNGADFSVCPITPLYGLYAACTRKPQEDVINPYPFGVDECISISQALRLYTINSAYCMFWEDKIGSLEPGKFADLVVWSGDFYSLPPEDWLTIQVEMTMINGEIVYKQSCNTVKE